MCIAVLCFDGTNTAHRFLHCDQSSMSVRKPGIVIHEVPPPSASQQLRRRVLFHPTPVQVPPSHQCSTRSRGAKPNSSTILPPLSSSKRAPWDTMTSDSNQDFFASLADAPVPSPTIPLSDSKPIHRRSTGTNERETYFEVVEVKLPKHKCFVGSP